MVTVRADRRGKLRSSDWLDADDCADCEAAPDADDPGLLLGEDDGDELEELGLDIDELDEDDPDIAASAPTMRTWWFRCCFRSVPAAA
jgi:hypothetical protein